MISNQKGFVFPLSLCMLLLFSSFLMIHMELYLNEKRQMHETRTILTQEYYVLKMVRILEAKLRSGEEISAGEVVFQDGRATYANEIIGTTFKIRIILTLASGYQAVGTAYFDKHTNQLVRWVETN